MSKLTKWLDFSRKSLPIEHKDAIWEPISTFQQEFDKLLQHFYHMLRFIPSRYSDIEISPYCDLVEDDECYKVELELPGVDENNIQIAIANGILSVKATKKTSRKDAGKKYISREISYGEYERKISLPENADAEAAEATFKKGMLWVTFPKKKDAANKIRELAVKKASA